MQEYANNVAASMDTTYFQRLCETIIEHGPTVYAAGEEVIFEGLAGALGGDLFRRQ